MSPSLRFACLIMALLPVLGRAEDGPISPPANPLQHTLRGSTTQYYLSLPNGWTSDKSWPILVTIHGGGFMPVVQARKDLPFIVVSPGLTSNGKDPAEEQVLYAIVREVQKDYNGQPKIFMTGYSAGGHVTYQVIMAHPELLAAAALASTTYLGRGVTDISQSPDRVQLPIHAFLGDKDPHYDSYSTNWNTFKSVAQANGYTNIELSIATGVGHSPFIPEVVAFFASLLPK